MLTDLLQYIDSMKVPLIIRGRVISNMILDSNKIGAALSRLLYRGSAGWQELVKPNPEYDTRYPFYFESVVMQIERLLSKLTDS